MSHTRIILCHSFHFIIACRHKMEWCYCWYLAYNKHACDVKKSKTIGAELNAKDDDEEAKNIIFNEMVVRKL